MIVVDPDLSVYQLVQRQPQQNVFLNHRRTMSITSFEIENATLIDGARTRIFSGFQYMSKFLPQVKRYQPLAEKSEAVYVFGVPDIAPPPIPNITYVYLSPEDQLAKEWFIVSYGKSYFSALATEEQTRFNEPDQQRLFKGVWTFDLTMVQILSDWMSSLVDLPPLELNEQTVNLRGQLHLLNNSTSRLMKRLQSGTLPQSLPVIRQEIETLLERSLRLAQQRLAAS